MTNLRVNCPNCGALLVVDEVHIGREGQCKRCGAKFIISRPTDSQQASPPAIPLQQDAATTAEVRTSGLAIASFVLGILSIFTLCLTAVPAIVLGIVGLVKVEKSGGRLTGRAFAILGIVIPVVIAPLFPMAAILLPALARVRELSQRVVCGTNLSGIVRAMQVYSGDDDVGRFPRAGHSNGVWGNTRDWSAATPQGAFGDPPGSAGISASLYLLIKGDYMSPKQFVCPSDAGGSVFNIARESDGRFDYYDVWDFGPEPTKDHVSYAYHIPYTYDLRGTPTSFCLSDASAPGMAVLADRSPAGPGNSPSHQGEGQNVAFVDGHVGFGKTPTAGLNGDNIYMVGTETVPVFGSGPRDRFDSVLVNQP